MTLFNNTLFTYLPYLKFNEFSELVNDLYNSNKEAVFTASLLTPLLIDNNLVY